MSSLFEYKIGEKSTEILTQELEALFQSDQSSPELKAKATEWLREEIARVAKTCSNFESFQDQLNQMKKVNGGLLGQVNELLDTRAIYEEGLVQKAQTCLVMARTIVQFGEIEQQAKLPQMVVEKALLQFLERRLKEVESLEDLNTFILEIQNNKATLELSVDLFDFFYHVMNKILALLSTWEKETKITLAEASAATDILNQFKLVAEAVMQTTYNYKSINDDVNDIRVELIEMWSRLLEVWKEKQYTYLAKESQTVGGPVPLEQALKQIQETAKSLKFNAGSLDFYDPDTEIIREECDRLCQGLRDSTRLEPSPYPRLTEPQ
jgi:hypothetical protein